ncbi:MAG TPA: Tex-like N-terminal domain-containing protein [Vicinamibacteria bacterium]|nr:Tex-like N-terminal domain-containing protein [Vicinamibacteria bacterium]
MSDPLHPAFESWLQQRHPALPAPGARAVLELAAEGATLPFIVRYRKERTGNLDEVAVRQVLEAKDLFDRILSRQAIILESIERHATLTPELRARIEATFDLDQLEDLYHPFRQVKKNRAAAAREAGLEPLADWIWNTGHGTETPQEGQTLELWAFTFRNEEKGIADAKAAIEGARDILVERLASDPELRGLVRRAYLEQGSVRATKAEKAKPHSKFETYFAFQEKVLSLREPAGSHRYLAIRRGQSEGELQVVVGGPAEDGEFEARLVAAFEERACSVPDAPGAEVLRHAGRIAFKNNVRTSIENEVHRVLKDAADAVAAQVFAENVRRLLLEPPFGPRPVLAIDPGVRTGCKLAAVDAAGALKAHEVIHLQTDEQKTAAREALARMARESGAAAVSVGNGTGGREAEVFARRSLREAGLAVPVVLVSEAGASVYSTSDVARAEFPDLDATVRGAVSIARRLQDPLAELVKIEPRAIGVGQYQHDVARATLEKALDAVIEGAVNGVGVNVNTASPHLLSRVAGIGPALALAIVQHRQQKGLFRSRQQLLEVPRLGARAFEQAAGFLRIPDAENPLDNTAVHPERYAALEALAARLGRSLPELMGPGARLVREATSLRDQLGAFTWQDIVEELEKPGRDPRGRFTPFSFREDVQKLEDLKPGMTCPGIVSNVTNFGAFVDVGVHQDGLVHVSQLGRTFVKEPREVVAPGDRVEVRVLKVDLDKKQISLSMRPATPRPQPRPAAKPRPARAGRPASTAVATAMAERAAGPRAARTRTSSPPLRPVAAHPPRVSAEDHPAAAPAAEAAPPPTPRPAPPSQARDPRPPESRRPRPPAERRPEPRRPAFNNPFAVLAGLKVPPKGSKS